jgi:hypothetical protein
MSLRYRIAIVGLFALTASFTLDIGSALAADLPLLPLHSRTHHKAAPAADTGRLEDFAKGPNAGCTAWTDDCRACGKNPDGVVCSNVGIACLPSRPHCTRQ